MAHDINIDIGKRLKFFRELLDIDQKTLAGDIKISVNVLSQYEKGEKTSIYGAWNFAPLYEPYGLSLTWLASGEGNIFAFKGPKTPLHKYLVILALYLGNNSPDNLENLVILMRNKSLIAGLKSSINALKTEFDSLLQREKEMEKQQEQVAVKVGPVLKDAECIRAGI